MNQFILIILLGFIATGCISSPTGRTQLIVVSDGQMSNLGDQSFDEMKKKIPVEQDARTNQYVRCIASAIAREAHDPTGVRDWEVVVFRENSANAFALPGGKIGVHTGILTVANNQHRLAAVLGHEVGHVTARHGAERVSQAMAAQSGLLLANIFMSDTAPETRGTVMAALGLGAQFGVLMPFGRQQESEADEIGLYIMADAGFNPDESVQLWVNMGKATKGSPPEFLSTHPSHETRIEDLRANMAKAREHYRRAQSQGKNPQCG